MTRLRREFAASEKAVIVWRQFNGKDAISAMAQEPTIQPTQMPEWGAQVQEPIEMAFERYHLG